MLDELLAYQQKPEAGEFVSAVMQRVQRQQRLRQLILLISGVVGVVFGVIGAFQLAGPLAPWISQLLTGDQAAINGGALLLLLALLAWFLHEEPDLSL